ncbi:unnamed protein product [Oncorhynchus mykiss]|uniref:Uncharacterized protein n=1 Tax=Oncorhynchus mykiss TaxID=8022 RepID=A0A061ADJ8_ONCMY|nr:unnamed protein product [Oncorhynchus mykiss]
MNSIYHLVFLVPVLVGAQQLLPGSCSFDTGTCDYTSDLAYARWTRNEEGWTTHLLCNQRCNTKCKYRTEGCLH